MGLDDEQKRFLWIAVGGVIAFLAVMILFRQNNNASATSGASTSPSSSSPSYVPTTDYTYTQDSYNQGPTPTPTPTPSGPPSGPTGPAQPVYPNPKNPNPGPIKPIGPIRPGHGPTGPAQPVRTPAQYVTAGTWQNGNPPWNSYLSGIAAHEGESLSYLESLNPQISNPNLIYPGQRVEVRPGSGSAFPMASASDRGYAPVDNLALAPMPY